VADGVVRMVQGAGGDWGFLVLLEHRLPSGDYVCSLYGHAGFDVLVKPGEIVRRGQKIATLGLSCAVENGGYGAHLHFGIADGPFRRPSLEKGAEVDVDHGGAKVRAKVVRLVYRPEETDRFGFAGLGAEVALPDGATAVVPVPAGEPAAQTAWIKGYVPDCRGWFDPFKFIGERRPKD
jgi:murein DD-endopeptidase MepM/ murein hydrolase activator NlpD